MLYLRKPCVFEKIKRYLHLDQKNVVTADIKNTTQGTVIITQRRDGQCIYNIY